MPLKPYQRHLLLIEDDKGECAVDLENCEYSIGRDHECDIRLCSLFVSRHHATLVRVPVDEGIYSYRIVDGKPNGQRSANGLLINGAKLRAHNLQDEDEVVFGPQVRFTYHVLERDPDVTDPFGGYDPNDPTLINPRTAGREYDRETPPELLKFPWNKSLRKCHLTRSRKRFLNINGIKLRGKSRSVFRSKVED